MISTVCMVASLQQIHEYRYNCEYSASCRFSKSTQGLPHYNILSSVLGRQVAKCAFNWFLFLPPIYLYLTRASTCLIRLRQDMIFPLDFFLSFYLSRRRKQDRTAAEKKNPKLLFGSVKLLGQFSCWIFIKVSEPVCDLFNCKQG